MKKVLTILVLALALCGVGYAQYGGAAYDDTAPMVADVANKVTTQQNQNVSVGGTTSQVNIDSAGKTPPLTTFPPYLPYWNHGGWGTIKAYFPNGPTANDQVYETTFDPNDPRDMRELRTVLHALPHKGLLAAAGGMLNTVAVVLFNKPDTYFHGRGIDIADSIVRDRRPEGKSLLVFIDSNVDMRLLGEEGYAYMGKVSVEADTDRNWDQAYKAAVSEALLWDVDILLVSGGMKGVTTGTNITWPSAAGGYSQVNYSLSLLGGKATGITEGQGKAILSAEAYRFAPQTIERRRIPAVIYDRIRSRPWPTSILNEVAPPPTQVRERIGPARYESAGTSTTQAPASAAVCPAAGGPAQAVIPAPAPASSPARRGEPGRPSYIGPGVTMSRELYDLAGFPNDQQVGYVNVR
jgi:hypothetical protein